MPRTEETFSIFLASPGDVAEERNRLVETIARWNKVWGRHLGVRLELLRWENDAFPDIGIDAQDVINGQIPQDYDLFIGVMWTRFGTPTSRAASGTEEEFNRALDRYKKDKNSVNILFYFKDSPVNPSKINPDQIEKINSFKKKIQSNGLLTWDFLDIDQFEKLVEIHVTKHIQKRKNRTLVHKETSHEEPQKEIQPLLEDDDYGYIDSIEEFSTRSEEISAIVDRFTKAQNELTERLQKSTADLEELQKDPENLSASKFRKSLGMAASEMEKFTGAVDLEIPEFHSAMEGSMSALVKTITITAELYPEKIPATKESAEILLANLITARESVEEFSSVTAALPRLTKELNTAKRKQVQSLNRFIAELKNGEQLLNEALLITNDLSQQAND